MTDLVALRESGTTKFHALQELVRVLEPLTWTPPVVLGDRCMRCGALLDHDRDFDNHGPCQREQRPEEAEVLRLLDAARAGDGLLRAGADALVEAVEKFAEYEQAHPLSGGLRTRLIPVLTEAGGLRAALAVGGASDDRE